MRHLRFAVILAALAGLMMGCGANLPPLNFAVPDVSRSPNRLDAELRAITVTAAQSGEATGQLPIDQGTLALWKEALEEAVTRAAVFNDDSRRRVSLQVKVLKVDPPSVGSNFSTDTDARYELVDRSNGNIMFSRMITSNGSTPMEFSFLGVIRQRESINRSVQNNIRMFVRSLGQIDRLE